ncbi:uncharacterized protein IL334_002262 [Kwoniella shivajii]|uniref:HpcH/HpaI aldolase/citrate lyase domain-containing protein n=1 Tax=Kwoniella shivajii TaxID=564305 RepID=A0ABZ1CU86_9TREE|nr:hypothetical protein IL334_002262 [Kwoniella shivajii]
MTTIDDPVQMALAREAVRPNLVKQTMLSGHLASSFGLRMALSVEMPLVAKRAGYQGLLMNVEHTAINIETMSYISTSCLNVGISPIVVVPTCSPEWISRVLDSGAQCVIVPHVNNKEEAKICVESSKFPPIGKRSITMVTPQTQYTTGINPRVLANVANEEIMVIPMIETVQGIDNIKEIAGMQGIDCLLIGCADLSVELDCPQEYDNPIFMSAITKIVEAAEEAGIYVGLGGLEPFPHKIEEIVMKYNNVRYVMAGRDISFLQAGMKNQIASLSELDVKLQS